MSGSDGESGPGAQPAPAQPAPAQPAPALPLPTAPHRPGSGSAPDMAPLERAKDSAPARTDPEAWRENTAYRYGWHLFDEGFYWEAHEVWEAVWLACRPNSRERLVLQALIQLANARLKAAMGQPRAVRRLAAEVERLLAEPGLSGDPVMGVSRQDLERLLREIDPE